MIVSKFGGSSVADANQIRKVAGILNSSEERTIAVVSAPGKRFSSDIKITDMLYTCQAEASEGISITDRFDAIRTRYLEIAQDLGLQIPELAEELDTIEKRISDGAGPDYAASRGEYLSAMVIAAFMGWEFLDTERYIILNDDGTVAEDTYAQLNAVLHEGTSYILPGFYGANSVGEIKTFSRGGSDITGAIAARSIGAALYENWTDVSGIRMADPRIVDDPAVVHELTYQEIRELASVGAGVFHEEAIAPVRSVKIPICVKNTNAPDESGTMIVSERDDQSSPIVGISGKTGYKCLYLKKLMLNKDPDYKLKVRMILKVYGLTPEFSSIGFDSLSFYFTNHELCDMAELTDRIKRDLGPDEITVDRHVAMIGVVGNGLYDAEGVLSRLSGSLSDAHIPIRYLNYGGSQITCIIGVDDHEYEHALKVMYSSLV